MIWGVDFEPWPKYLTGFLLIGTVWLGIHGLGRKYRTEKLQKLNAAGRTGSVLRSVFEESNRVSAERIALSVRSICPEPPIPFLRMPVPDGAAIHVRSASGNLILTASQKVDVGFNLIFHGFLGDLGPFETFSAWKDAHVTIGVTTTLGGIGMNIDQAMAEMKSVERPPCPIIVMLLLNGRRVLTANSNIVKNAFGEYAAGFDDVPVENNQLPSFRN